MGDGIEELQVISPTGDAHTASEEQDLSIIIQNARDRVNSLSETIKSKVKIDFIGIRNISYWNSAEIALITGIKLKAALPRDLENQDLTLEEKKPEHWFAQCFQYLCEALSPILGGNLPPAIVKAKNKKPYQELLKELFSEYKPDQANEKYILRYIKMYVEADDLKVREYTLGLIKKILPINKPEELLSDSKQFLKYLNTGLFQIKEYADKFASYLKENPKQLQTLLSTLDASQREKFLKKIQLPPKLIVETMRNLIKSIGPVISQEQTDIVTKCLKLYDNYLKQLELSQYKNELDSLLDEFTPNAITPVLNKIQPNPATLIDVAIKGKDFDKQIVVVNYFLNNNDVQHAAQMLQHMWLNLDSSSDEKLLALIEQCKNQSPFPKETKKRRPFQKPSRELAVAIDVHTRLAFIKLKQKELETIVELAKRNRTTQTFSSALFNSLTLVTNQLGIDSKIRAEYQALYNLLDLQIPSKTVRSTNVTADDLRKKYGLTPFDDL